MKKIIVGIFIVSILFSGCKKKDEYGFDENVDRGFNTVKVDTVKNPLKKQNVEVTSLFDGTKYIFKDAGEVNLFKDAFMIETKEGKEAWFLMKDYSVFTTDSGVEYLTEKE